MEPTPLPKEVLVNAEVFFNLFKVLEKIESIVSDDFCGNIEYALMKDTLITEKEKIMAKKLEDIYRFAHAFSRTCGHNHPDWKEEALK